MLLYHYTCLHGCAGIEADRATRPHPHPLLRGLPAVTWLTDLDAPNRDALGLTSRLLSCDRTRYRLTIHQDLVDNLMHWPCFAYAWALPLDVRRNLESGKALPMHWWVTTQPINTANALIIDCRTGKGVKILNAQASH